MGQTLAAQLPGPPVGGQGSLGLHTEPGAQRQLPQGSSSPCPPSGIQHHMWVLSCARAAQAGGALAELSRSGEAAPRGVL